MAVLNTAAEKAGGGLGSFILRKRADILSEWERSLRTLPVARPLSAPQLMHHAPAILDRLAQVAEGGAQTLGELADTHAVKRLTEGFDLSGVAAEYGMLRESLLRLYTQEQGPLLPAVEVQRFEAGIDGAMVISANRYADARERTLVALDRISEAALESGDAELFLPRLLRVLLETNEAVDTAKLLLREGEVLRVRAALGLEEAAPDGSTVRVGEGFAGRIAETGQPQELQVATDPRAEGEALHGSGVRALYGVPLLEHDQVIGVATIGSRTAYAFSNTDKMLVRTMVQRATAILLRARLRDREREARERAEHALAQVDALLAAAPAGVAFLDPQLRYMRVNASLADANGHAPEAHVGRTLGEVLGPEQAPRFEPLLREVLERGQMLHGLEFTAAPAARPGELRHWSADYFPVRTPEGRVLGVGGMVTDVTERKRAEALLRRWEQVFTHVTSGVITVDARTGRLLEVNPAFARMHGYTVEELRDVPLAQLIEPGWQARREAYRERADAQGHLQAEELHVRKDGSVFPALDVVTSVRGPDGQVLYRIGNVVDISEQRVREQQLAQAAEFRERFLGIVSHDLRSPLAAISLATSVLLKDDKLGDGHRRAVGRIANASERMARMIHALLDFTRGRLGQGIPIWPREAHLEAICRGMLDELELAYPTRELLLQAHGDLWGTWDADRIAQVVGNLGKNALEYSAPDTPVEVMLESLGERVRLTVRNQGTPIAPELLPNIFEPFRRGEAGRARASSGLGLGLFIVQLIASAHGGTAEVHSDEREGTRFTVTLPRHSLPHAAPT